MYDAHEFDALLAACVRAFADDRPEDWGVLLGQAHIAFDPGPPFTACVPAGTDAPRTDMLYLTAIGMLQPPGQGAVQDDIPLALHGYSLMSDLNWTEFISQRGTNDHEG